MTATWRNRASASNLSIRPVIQSSGRLATKEMPHSAATSDGGRNRAHYPQVGSDYTFIQIDESLPPHFIRIAEHERGERYAITIPCSCGSADLSGDRRRIRGSYVCLSSNTMGTDRTLRQRPHFCTSLRPAESRLWLPGLPELWLNRCFRARLRVRARQPEQRPSLLHAAFPLL